MSLRKIILPWESHPDRDQTWYDTQRAKMTDDEVARELDRNYAKSISGKVFTSFNERRHWVKTPLQANPELPIYRIWDFGTVNACLFGQVDRMNRRRLLHEVVLGTLAHGSNTPEQIQAVLADSERFFPRYSFLDICDPAGSYRDHRTGKEEPRTDIQQMEAHGVRPRFERIQQMPTRGRKERSRTLVQYDLEKTPGGEEGFLLYANEQRTEGCPVTLTAMQGAYRHKQDTSGNFRDEILEEHPYEDVIDCLLYWYLETLPQNADRPKQNAYYNSVEVDPYTGYRY